VILAHKLLKNNINNSEYLLLTENTFDIYPETIPAFVKELKQMNEGSTDYAELGNIPYRYFLLNHLHDKVKELPTKVHPHKFKNPVRYDGIINATKEKVYEIISNLEYRTSINKSASDFIYDREHVNRVGFVHECVINNRNYSIETISNDFGNDKLVYGELVKKIPIARKMYSYTILENHAEGTKVYYEVHLEPIPVLTWLLSIFIRPFMRNRLRSSFYQLKEYCEQSN